MRASSFSSTASGVFPGARPVRFETRKMCVSTAIVGSPKATLSTTFAVLRPTPGSASSASRLRGTCPPWRSISSRQVSNRFFALVRNRPMVRMYSVSAGRPRARTLAGVFATTNRRRVALFTPTSVACAESSTAASSSNTLVYSSSVFGCGLAAASVAKRGAISAVFTGGSAARLGARGARRRGAAAARWRRVPGAGGGRHGAGPLRRPGGRSRPASRCARR